MGGILLNGYSSIRGKTAQAPKATRAARVLGCPGFSILVGMVVHGAVLAARESYMRRLVTIACLLFVSVVPACAVDADDDRAPGADPSALVDAKGGGTKNGAPLGPQAVDTCDVLVAGGSLGGVAAAHEAASAGAKTCLVASSDWLGGQMTAQGVPFDEHAFVFSRTFADIRARIRRHYQESYALVPGAITNETRRERGTFDPGSCWVSSLCHEPRVSRRIVDELLAALTSSGKLVVYKGFEPTAVTRAGARITGASFGAGNGNRLEISARVTIDATELGDLLPLGNVPFRVGADAKSETEEPDAKAVAEPESVQPFTFVFAVEQRPDSENHRIAKPAGYDPSLYGLFGPWKGHLFRGIPERGGDSFWTYRRMIAKENFANASFANDIALINWSDSEELEGGGNDFNKGCGPDGCNVIGKDAAAQKRILARARQHALGFLYWLQTDAPRDEGDGKGYPNLLLRKDVFDTADGLSVEPYIREARRVKAIAFPRQQDLMRTPGRIRPPVSYSDAIGTAAYIFDLHNTASGGAQPITMQAAPSQTPLGALIPADVDGLLMGGKAIGSSHITNGIYRLHSAEWAIGQAAGAAAALALEANVELRRVRDDERLLRRLQRRLVEGRGGPIYHFSDIGREDPLFVPAQMLAVSGVMVGQPTSLAFGAEDVLRRDQAASVIVRALGITPVTQCRPTFGDVPCTNTHYGAVQALADRAVTNGTSQGIYDPGAAITRAQLVTMLVRATCEPTWSEAACPLPNGSSFSDVAAGSTHAATIESARTRGWLAGEGASFRPNDPVTRREAAPWLWRVLEKRLSL